MLELFEGTGNLTADIKFFQEYLGSKYKSKKLIRTKTRQDVYLVNENDDNIDFKIYHGRVYVLSSMGIVGLLTYEVYKNALLLVINDIQFKDPVYYNIGIGTAILKYLEDISSKENIKLIKGTLTSYDIENNRDALLHFYSKYDFNIDFYHREVKKIIGNL